MTTNRQDAVELAIVSFLSSSNHHYDFPAGGKLSIPSETEASLIDALQRITKPQLSDIGRIRQMLSFRDCYTFLIFAVRMALLGARRGNASLLRSGLIGLIVDNGQVDYRDILCALSIIENCASRIHVDLQGEIRLLNPLIEDDRLRQTIEGYFSREPQMRQTNVMGFEMIDGKEGVEVIERG